MDNFLINQRIKIIKSFILSNFFDLLIIYELTLTSYLNRGQWKTDKDFMVFGHMAIIPFPVLCECHNLSKRAKTTGLKRAKMTD